MDSRNIYNYNDNRVPYFYILQHVKTKRKYAGSKRGVDANPNNFMTNKGYKTSSRIIKDIIREEGLDSFKIILLKYEIDCKMSVYDYETRWLNDHQCAQSKEWYNKHNNHHFDDSFYPLSTEEMRLLQEKTTIELRNKIDPISGLSGLQQRSINTAKTKRSMVINGRPYYDYIGDKISKAHNKIDEDTGLSIAKLRGKKISEVRLKNGIAKGKNNPRYGVKLPQELKDKISNSVKGFKHSEEAKKKMRKAKKIKIPCPHCTKKVDSSNYKRWHGDNCKNKS